MRQWWCGRPVPMAGVSSVRVAPEDRGRGIGRLAAHRRRPPPTNSGRWQLTVAEGVGVLDLVAPAPPAVVTGTGTLDPTAQAPPGAVHLGARGLAALYAGTPLVTLRQAGLASGGKAEDDAALDAAFAATPYMLDGF
jgi:Sterol carrier protein domain